MCQRNQRNAQFSYSYRTSVPGFKLHEVILGPQFQSFHCSNHTHKLVMVRLASSGGPFTGYSRKKIRLNWRKIHMSKNPKRDALEAYLRAKEASGELLPGIKGRVNYRGISIETGIAHEHFFRGRELRLHIEASCDRIGVSNEPLTKKYCRARHSEINVTPMTYDDLRTYGRAWLQRHGYAQKSVASDLSHLNAYMRYFKRHPSDSPTEEFGVYFESRSHTYLKAMRKGKAVASILRLWATIYHELYQSSHSSLDFAATLTELVTESGRTQKDIASAAGIKHVTMLWRWIVGDRKPTDPEQVARLEKVLDAPLGTLSSKLIFHRARRNTIIKEWWPKSWHRRKSYSRFRRERVLAKIPEHLFAGPPELLKPAFDKALQEVHEGEGEPAFRRNFRSLIKKGYYLLAKDWPDHLEAEWLALKEYKTAPGSFHNKKRGRRWKKPTAELVEESLKSFFGFLCLPADHPDPQLKGMGLRPENLSLAWLAVQEVVENYLVFRLARAGAHSRGTKTFITRCATLLRPESGWLWLHPELLDRLPKSQQQLVEATGGWKAYCKATRAELLDSLEWLESNGQIKQTRETMLLIAPILDDPEPLSLIDRALDLHQQDLEGKAQLNALFSPQLAVGWRDLLLISFLARFPLRAKQWGLLTYREDGSGYLRKHPRDGWLLVIPYDDFKNVDNLKIFTFHSQERVLVLKLAKLEAFEQLIPLLEFYLEKARPIIVGTSDFLFPTINGDAMSAYAIYVRVIAWSSEYLSQYSPRKLGIEGVFPFGPHAFRDIVATHLIKTEGSISLAAHILLDSEETVRRHYARFLPEDRVGLAVAKLAAAFKKKGHG